MLPLDQINDSIKENNWVKEIYLNTNYKDTLFIRIEEYKPIGIYFFNFNVQNRINAFFSPEQYDVSQVNRSINAFKEGGFFGVGPGEGQLKHNLQESHTDYIFAVIGEEYGAIGCLGILLLFFYIAYRVFQRAYDEQDHFIQLSLFSLTVYLIFQTLLLLTQYL